MSMRRTTKRWSAVAGALTLAVALSGCRYTGFADAPSKTAAGVAVNWVRTQQNNDGGFEHTTSVAFETPDAIIAIAENAQQQGPWNKAQALAAVQATVKNGNTPLHFLDNLVDQTGAGAIDAGTAAKIIVLVALPLGLSPTNFNPDGDTAKNLVATVQAGARPDGSYSDFFGQTLVAAQALRLAVGAVPANTLTLIRSAQKSDGSWDFAGDSTGTGGDIDTTGSAVATLAAAGVAGTDADLRAGLHYLALQQRSDGAWESFGDPDPNSTSVAIFGITAAGFDPGKPCWRDVIAPGLAGNPYTSPMAWLRSQQVTSPPAQAGRIASPADGFGINTLATTQSVEAFRRGWIPVLPVPPQTCPQP